MAPVPNANVNPFSMARVVALLTVFIAGALGLRQCTPSRVDPVAPQRTLIQPLRDDYEVTIFMKRGAFAPSGLRPYLDVFSEYPPLATYAFGFPFLFVKTARRGASRAIQLEVESAAPNADLSLAYADVWVFAMAAVWLATAIAVAQLARDVGLQPARALCLVAPTALYCSIQRFDPLPALAVILAMLAFVRGHGIRGFALLAAGVMLKLYPAVLVFLAAGYVARRNGFRTAFLGLFAFAAVCAVAMLPAAMAGFADPAWTAPHRLHTGDPKSGVDGALAAILVPFQYQGARDTNAGSLAERLFRGWLQIEPYETFLAYVKSLRWLQFGAALPAFALGWLRPTRQTLLAGSAALVTAFVVFHNIYSPQFHVWLAPLAAVAGGGAVGAAAFACVMAVDVVTYVQFPILAPLARFDPATAKNVYPDGFWTVVDLRILLTLLLLVLLATLAFRKPEFAGPDGRAA